jgi:hypothetical protein
MKSEPLDCAEIRNSLVAGRVPEGAAVDAHLLGCASCRELLASHAALGRELAAAAIPPFEADGLFRSLEQDLKRERGLRAVLRALPSGVRVSLWCGLALALMAFEFAFHRRPDFSAYAPGVFWTIAAALLLGLAIGASRLLRGPSLPERGQRWVSLVLFALPVAAALCAPLGSNQTANFGAPERCFTYGALLVVPFLLLYWLLERRDHSAVPTLVSAGAAAGIAANLLLHAHCPSVHPGHLLLGHASIGVAWALLLCAPRLVQRAR